MYVVTCLKTRLCISFTFKIFSHILMMSFATQISSGDHRVEFRES